MRRSLVLTATVTAALVAGLTACGTQTADGRGQQGGAAKATTTEGPRISPAPTPTETAASKEISLNGQKLPLEVYSLERNDTFVTLHFGLKNDTEDQFLKGGNWLRGSPFSRTGENDVSGVYLVDGKNKKKYEPAVFGGNCVCSRDLDEREAGPGQTLYLQATYAAPPDDVTTMDVNFPNFGTLTKVSVS